MAKHCTARLRLAQDGTGTLLLGRRQIPILGVANCTNHPLPAARATAVRVAAFLRGGPTVNAAALPPR